MDDNLKNFVNQIKEIENSLGKFIIVGDLGNGGTAIVKKVEMKGCEADCKYAVKFLLVDIADDKSSVYKRFRQAYINLASVQHLGCCIPLFYFGEHEGRLENRVFKIPYVMMREADTTMYKRYTQETKKGKHHIVANYDEFRQIFERLGEVIQIIHEQGIIHRDIKPQNIFYCSDKLYLADSDISKFSQDGNYVEARTKKGDRLANMNFSAPEQFDNSVGEICNASDWFAFAQVMIWLMTGHPIIKGFAKVSLPGTDKRFKPYEKLFDKLLQTDPRQHFSSFVEIKQYLSDNDEELRIQEREQERERHRCQVRKCLNDFLVTIDFYTPQFNGLWQADLITRHDEICGFFERLNALMACNSFGIVYKGGDIQNVKSFECVKGCLWKFSGYGTFHYEVAIDEVLAYQHHNLGGSFAVIIGRKMARQYDIKGTSEAEEFLRYKGHKLPLSVGQSARIKGRLVKIDANEVEHVIRYVEPAAYILGPLESPINENIDMFMNVCESFSSVQALRDHVVNRDFVRKIKRPEWVSMYD